VRPLRLRVDAQDHDDVGEQPEFLAIVGDRVARIEPGGRIGADHQEVAGLVETQFAGV
jgi:hypothetical protein